LISFYDIQNASHILSDGIFNFTTVEPRVIELYVQFYHITS
jgi:hypothetical protein